MVQIQQRFSKYLSQGVLTSRTETKPIQARLDSALKHIWLGSARLELEPYRTWNIKLGSSLSPKVTAQLELELEKLVKVEN